MSVVDSMCTSLMCVYIGCRGLIGLLMNEEMHEESNGESM